MNFALGDHFYIVLTPHKVMIIPQFLDSINLLAESAVVTG